MITSPSHRLAAAAAVCLALAACDEGGSGSTDPKGGATTAPVTRDAATQAAEACTGNMRLAVARDTRLKAFAGREGPLCACLVEKIKADPSLKDEDRTPIYAALRTKPGSPEARQADRALTPAGGKAIAAAMVACGKTLTETK